MKGKLIAAQCCACGAWKGDRDKNSGWWVLYPREARGIPREVRNYCPACAPGLLVRSDEVQTDPRPMHGLRIVSIRDLRAILSALRTAATDSIDPRSTIGWRAAERVAKSIGFDELPPATQLREFGFVLEESR